MRLELDADFLRTTPVVLDVEDLRLGLSLGLISPTTAVEMAREALDRGSSDRVMLGLVEIDRSEPAAVRAALRAVDPADAELFPPSSVRKWTYLQLQAAFDLRDRLADPLGVVEEIYADFDYPEAVSAFVRYMPPPPGMPVGEEALIGRWARYLARESAALAPGAGVE